MNRQMDPEYNNQHNVANYLPGCFKNKYDEHNGISIPKMLLPTRSPRCDAGESTTASGGIETNRTCEAFSPYSNSLGHFDDDYTTPYRNKGFASHFKHDQLHNFVPVNHFAHPGQQSSQIHDDFVVSSRDYAYNLKNVHGGKMHHCPPYNYGMPPYESVPNLDFLCPQDANEIHPLIKSGALTEANKNMLINYLWNQHRRYVEASMRIQQTIHNILKENGAPVDQAVTMNHEQAVRTRGRWQTLPSSNYMSPHQHDAEFLRERQMYVGEHLRERRDFENATGSRPYLAGRNNQSHHEVDLRLKKSFGHTASRLSADWRDPTEGSPSDSMDWRSHNFPMRHSAKSKTMGHGKLEKDQVVILEEQLNKMRIHKAQEEKAGNVELHSVSTPLHEAAESCKSIAAATELGASDEMAEKRSFADFQTKEQAQKEMVHLALHKRGWCKPCAFYYSKKKKCRNGSQCEFCHHEDHSKLTLKQWKKRQHKMVQEARTLNEESTPGLDNDSTFSPNNLTQIVSHIRSQKPSKEDSVGKTTKAMDDDATVKTLLAHVTSLASNSSKSTARKNDQHRIDENADVALETAALQSREAPQAWIDKRIRERSYALGKTSANGLAKYEGK